MENKTTTQGNRQPNTITGRHTDALEGFSGALQPTRGKYTLLTTKRKYEGARHVKQAYNNRQTIQAKHSKDNRRNACRVLNMLKFCHKVSTFCHLKNPDVCVIFAFMDFQEKITGGLLYIAEKIFSKNKKQNLEGVCVGSRFHT